MKRVLLALIICSSLNIYAQQAVTTFIFLPHAEIEMIGGDPPLSETGKARAECLAGVLSIADITAVYTSPLNRTRQTARLIAKKNNLEISEYDPNSGTLMRELKKKHEGETLVLVGQFNTIPLYLNAIMGTDSYKIEDEENNWLYIVKTTSYKPLDVYLMKYNCELTNN